MRALWAKAVDLGLVVELHIGPNYGKEGETPEQPNPHHSLVLRGLTNCDGFPLDLQILQNPIIFNTESIIFTTNFTILMQNSSFLMPNSLGFPVAAVLTGIPDSVVLIDHLAEPHMGTGPGE